jgi:hypothetical protein
VGGCGCGRGRGRNGRAAAAVERDEQAEDQTVEEVLDDEGAPASHFGHVGDLIATAEEGCGDREADEGAEGKDSGAPDQAGSGERRSAQARRATSSPKTAPYMAAVIMWMATPKTAGPNSKWKGLPAVPSSIEAIIVFVQSEAMC